MITSNPDSKLQTDIFRFEVALSVEQAVQHLKSDGIRNIRCRDFRQTTDSLEFKIYYGKLFKIQFVAMGHIYPINATNTSIKLVWERELKSVPIWKVSPNDKLESQTTSDVIGKYLFNQLLKIVFLFLGGLLTPIISSIAFALFGTFSFFNGLDTLAAFGFAASSIIIVSVGLRSYLDSNESTPNDTKLQIWQETKSRIMSHLTYPPHLER